MSSVAIDQSIKMTTPASLLAVRAVTSFVVLTSSTSTWHDLLKEAVLFAGKVANDLRDEAGYIVQSLRVITNPFSEYLNCNTANTALEGMDLIKNILKELEDTEKDLLRGTRIRFSIGAADATTLPLVPSLIRSGGDLSNCCINIPVDDCGVVDAAMVHGAALVCTELGATTDRGEGNFNFTINFNGPKLCPYFPAGFNTTESGKTFVIGLEYPDLLVHVLSTLADGRESVVQSPETRSDDWRRASEAMRVAVEAHLRIIVDICRRAEKRMSMVSGGVNSPFIFGGVDSSPAPSKTVQSMCRVVELLGVPHFGASGTTECCSMLTRLFKSLGQKEENPVPLVGFSGLMFAALEDQGLADAAAMGHYDIQHLLTYSAVCGIGLDTVPIPFETLPEDIARLAQDVGAYAFRLNKPLTVRLFPVPGLVAGDMTKFESEDLCNCTVFAVP